MEPDVKRRLVEATTRLVALRSEIDQLQADLSWLHLTAACSLDLGDDDE